MFMSFYSGEARTFVVVDYDKKKMKKYSQGSSWYSVTDFDICIRVSSVKEVIRQFERQGFVLLD